MSVTSNKGYQIITTGSSAGLWGDILNQDVIDVIDTNLGGIVTKSVAGSNITLTSDEAENCILRLIGAQSADIQVSNSCVGFYFVENLTTNAFNITVTNGVAGVIIPKGRSTVIGDPTNGCRIAGTAGLPPGTRQLFFNSSAPTGYTKDTSLNNGTIRMVSGSVGADGGSSDFTSVFGSRLISQANIPNYSLPVTDPGHSHTITAFYATSTGGGTPGFITGPRAGSRSDLTSASTSQTGISVGSGGSGTAMDFNIKYCDAIRATVN